MKLFRAATAAFILCAAAALARGQGNLLPLPDEHPARGMTFPAISPDGKTVCFSYLGDLWTVDSNGGTANRLTVHEAHDGYPRWSPDGRWIAFASDRYNAAPPNTMNYDVFVIPAAGGEARRLTSYTGNDYPSDWSPDGSRILFQSLRGTDAWQAYSIEVKSGVVKALTSDREPIRYATYSPDGNSIAYDRSGTTAIWWRPHYRGSANADIYSKNLATGKVSRVTTYDGMDLWPMYSHDGHSIYYVSDQLSSGAANIVYAPASGGKPTQVTHYTSGAVRWPNMARNGQLITYEYKGDIYTVSSSGGQPHKLEIRAPADEKTNSVTRLNLSNGATEVEISPNDKTLAIVVRGDIWTLPAAGGGEARRLTDDPANDNDIVWSPDNTKLAFISDRKGNFDIYTIDVTTKELKLISGDPNDEKMPHFSPDGKQLAFLRSGTMGGLYVANSDGTGSPRRLAESRGNNERSEGISGYSWSPDSKWIAFSRMDETRTVDIWVVPVAAGSPVNITFYPGINVEPEWARDGAHILFLSDRDRTDSFDLYSVPLQKEKDEPDPATPAAAAAAKPGPADVKIDFEDIENRARRLTTQGSGPFSITPDGKSAIFASASAGQPDYYSVSVRGGTVQRLTSGGEGLDAPKFGEDGSKFFAMGPGGTVRLIPRTGGGSVQIPFAAHMDVNRHAEVEQAFNEYWRRLNVGFYDPTMHGVDWRAVRNQYEPLLEGVATKEDFWYLLSEMVGELNASHTEPSPAPGPPGLSTAELGITFDQDYTGPGLKVTGYIPKGPDDDLGPRIKPGEYILQIDGVDVTWNEAMYDTLLDKAGKTVELLVNSTPAKAGARTVKLKPINFGQLAELLYEQRVTEARAEVDKLSSGRLAYIHIQGMDQPSLKRMERELWGKARTKDGLVLDVRNNGGGNTHDEILSELSRLPYGYTQPRDAARATQPFRHWDKPVVLLINQDSASDAEIFPNGFRTLKLGKIVGVPTPGYVIGTFDGRLQDGTGYRIPTQGYLDLNGKDMENNGVRPDILVEHTPDDITNHRDRQLEVAVETLLKGLPKRRDQLQAAPNG